MTLALIAFVLLPRNLQKSKYFTEEEKKCGIIRFRIEHAVESPRLYLIATLKPFTDLHTWMFGFVSLTFQFNLVSAFWNCFLCVYVDLLGSILSLRQRQILNAFAI